MRAAYEILLTRRNKVISPRQSVPPNVARAAPNPSQPQQERGGRRRACISSARSAEGSSCSNYYPHFNTSTSKLRFSKFDSLNFFFFPGAFGSFGLGRHGGGAPTSERSSEETRRCSALTADRCGGSGSVSPVQLRGDPGAEPGGAQRVPAP